MNLEMEKKRLSYSLSEDSIVMDVGGYEGKWTSDIFSKYKCFVYVFEPVQSFYNNIVKKFNGKDKIKLFNYALSNKNGNTKMCVNKDRSSMFVGKLNSEINMRDISEVIEELNLNTIDLIKINIEGAEYDLLDHIIEKNILTKFKNIQVQFHNFYPNAKERRDTIRKFLNETHEISFDYPFIWESWKLK